MLITLLLILTLGAIIISRFRFLISQFLLLVLDILPYHAVHRVQQGLLLDAHAQGEFAEIGGAQYLVGNDGDALHDASDGL